MRALKERALTIPRRARSTDALTVAQLRHALEIAKKDHVHVAKCIAPLMSAPFTDATGVVVQGQDASDGIPDVHIDHAHRCACSPHPHPQIDKPQTRTDACVRGPTR